MVNETFRQVRHLQWAGTFVVIAAVILGGGFVRSATWHGRLHSELLEERSDERSVLAPGVLPGSFDGQVVWREDAQQEGAQEMERGTSRPPTSSSGGSSGGMAADSVARQDPREAVESDRPTRVIRFNLFERNQEPVPRARRPQFQARETDRLYFSDFYAEALQGPMPDWSSLSMAGQRPTTQPAEEPPAESGVRPFDNLISGDVIEDLVKRNINQLNGQISTPGRFRSEYSSIHQTFVQLAALFAVNEHHGQPMRWQEAAGTYRSMLVRAAAGTRVGTEQAYQLAVRTRDDLQQIVRGERPALDIAVEPVEDWSRLFYRSPLMIWLESLAQEEMRPLLGDDRQIRENQAEILQQSEQIAMIAQLLLMPSMEGHDDPEYAKHAKEMIASIGELRAAYTRQDFSDVGVAANRLIQACDACHEDYR